MKAVLLLLCFGLPLPTAAQSLYPEPPAHAELLARRPDLAFEHWTYWRLDMDLLGRVNRQVNASMTYRAETRDAWGIGADCEDYAVRKLETLVAYGVPRGALRLAVGRVSGRGHAVLVVRGLWVLDNRHDAPYRLGTSDMVVEAWETDGRNWDPAGPFASLADHLRWSRQAGTTMPAVPGP